MTTGPVDQCPEVEPYSPTRLTYEVRQIRWENSEAVGIYPTPGQLMWFTA